MRDDTGGQPPILRDKDHLAPSVFTPDALLREARRQKGIAHGPVPELRSTLAACKGGRIADCRVVQALSPQQRAGKGNKEREARAASL